MKRIKNTLIASLFACAAFNAQAEVDPFSFGLKAGASTTPYLRDIGDVKINQIGTEHSFFDNPFVHGSFYGEYTFNDYVGLSLEAGYLRQGFTLKQEATDQSQNNSSNLLSISMITHGIETPISVCVYPLGREDEQAILKIMLGAAPYIPLKTICERGNRQIPLTSYQQNEIAPFGIAAKLGLEYEFNFGLSLGANYGLNLMNKFKLESGSPETTMFNTAQDIAPPVNINNLKDAKPDYFTIGLGYNFASLFSE